MVSASTGRSTRPFRRARAQVLAESDICAICGHPGARTGGHDIARAVDITMAEDPDNIVPVHGTGNLCPTCGRNCNREQGTKPLAAMRSTLKTSQDW
jgi:rRNA maturation endonuclease Nob1